MIIYDRIINVEVIKKDDGNEKIKSNEKEEISI